MGKRSNFERVERDFYPTPMKAVEPLLSHLPINSRYIEPCAGDGSLVRHLDKHVTLQCMMQSDIQPRHDDVVEMDAFRVDLDPKLYDLVITNPPWHRKFLHPFIDHCCSSGVPAWLLFDADWMHTKQSMEFINYCDMIVSVGRVKWFPDSTMTGKDNCCWYRFKPRRSIHTKFIGRWV